MMTERDQTTMSGVDGTASPPQATSPSLSPVRRHQLSRSLSEFASPDSKSGWAANTYYRSSSHRLQDGAGFSPVVMSPERSRQGSVQLSLPPLSTAREEEEVEGERRGAAARSGSDSSNKSNKLRPSQHEAETGGNTESLVQSMVQLHDFSTDASRQLDDAYYAVLERTSQLRWAVTQLRSLAEASRSAGDDFARDSRGLESRTATQLGAVGAHFQAHQAARVAGLRGRIGQGRDRVQALSARLDAVRRRVGAWERADRQWQERTRRRLKLIWSVMSAAVLVLSVMLWMVSGSAGSVEGRQGGGSAVDDLSGRVNLDVEPSRQTASGSRAAADAETSAAQGKSSWERLVDEVDGLHVLDEL